MSDWLKERARNLRIELTEDPIETLCFMAMLTVLAALIAALIVVVVIATWPFGLFILVGIVYAWKALLNYGKGEDE